MPSALRWAFSCLKEGQTNREVDRAEAKARSLSVADMRQTGGGPSILYVLEIAMLRGSRRNFILAISSSGIAPEALCSSENACAAKVRLQLAEFFFQKNLNAISPLIEDPWSGLRFCSGWGDRMWQEVGTALRGAVVVSEKVDQIWYLVRWPYPTEDGVQKKIFFTRSDSDWKLDLNSFLGPFPRI